MDDVVNSADEPAWGAEPEPAARGAFMLSHELPNMVHVDVPRVDTDVIGDEPYSYYEHSHSIMRLLINVN